MTLDDDFTDEPEFENRLHEADETLSEGFVFNPTINICEQHNIDLDLDALIQKYRDDPEIDEIERAYKRFLNENAIQQSQDQQMFEEFVGNSQKDSLMSDENSQLHNIMDYEYDPN